MSLRRGLVRPGLHHQRHRPGLRSFAPQRDAQERHGPPQRHGLCAAAPSSPSGRVNVRLNPGTWTQDFHRDHSDDIISVAVSPDRKLVATGQLGRKPSIVVWDAETCKTVRVLSGLHRRAVVSLAWSPEPGYRLLASLGADDDHTLGIYDWRDKVLLAKTPVSKTKAQIGRAHV